ncbi:MAG TPA: ABC transporter permease [Bradyrhizobium sp.]|nr:ABC transporter permease [Bradyrhizobium sp.]
MRSWAPLLALIVLCLGFGLAAPGFATVENLWTIADRSAIPLILAVGMTFVILQGSIDLSIQGVMAASSLTFAMCVLNSRTGLSLGVFGLVLATLVGAGLGLLSGLVTTCLRVPSFMVTLGIWSASTGIAMLLSGNQPPLIEDPTLRALGLGRSLAVPNLFLIAITVVLLGYALQSYTRFGRYSMVIGGGEDLARLLGLPVDRYRELAFAFAGLLSGLGGALESARIGLGHVDVGAGQMFATITAVVIGGTSLGGGRGGVLQSAVGALTLAVLNNGMIFVGISPYAQTAVQGALILLAVLLATWPLRSRLRIVK